MRRFPIFNLRFLIALTVPAMLPVSVSAQVSRAQYQALANQVANKANKTLLSLRTAGAQPVGTRPNIYYGGRQQITSGAPTGYTYRVGHIVRYPCGFFQLLYSNTYKNGYGETPNTNDISIKAGLERPIGVIMPVYFRGQRTTTLNGGAYVWSDPLGYAVMPITGTVTNASTPTTTQFATNLLTATNLVYTGDLVHFTSGALSGQELYVTNTTLDSGNLATLTTQAFSQAPVVGDQFTVYPVVYERVYVSVSTNNFFFPTGLTSLGGGASPPFEGRNTTGDFVDSAANIATTTQAVFSAHGLYGQPTAGCIPAVCYDGDSQIQGTGDPDSAGQQGFAYRAINNQYPYVTGAVSGEATWSLEETTNPGVQGILRQVIGTGCTAFLCNMGHNDLANSKTAAQIKAGVLEITRRYNQQGMKVYWCTLTPWTTSTTGWTDTANQTQTAHEADRTAVNDWLRDTSAAGYVAMAGGPGNAAVFDVAAPIEVNAANVLTQDGGYWRAVAAIDSGTSSGSNTTTTLNDTTKNWTTNQWVGYWVVIGTGTGSSSTSNDYGYIVSNTATQLTIKNNWQSSTPDNTSTYAISNAYTGDGIHPNTNGHIAMAAIINMAQMTALGF